MFWNKKIPHYKILVSRRSEWLEKEVNEHLRMGYEPLGGVATSFDRSIEGTDVTIMYFSQAMLKKAY